MLVPIQVGNELVCPCGCGCVVGTVEESHVEEFHNDRSEISSFTPSASMMLLGSALEKNVRQNIQRSPQQVYEERTLRKLIDITEKYGLPENFALTVFNGMKKKNRGFRSETEPIKQLIRLLSKDENFLYINKMRAIKASYENISNI